MPQATDNLQLPSRRSPYSSFVAQLAEYEKLSHKVVASEERLRNTLFGMRPFAEVLIAYSMANQRDLRSFFTTTQLSWPCPASIWKTCSFIQSSADTVGQSVMVYLAKSLWNANVGD